MITIDLNCDAGESPASIADGSQERLMTFVSSVNVTCGAHAGDKNTIEATIKAALKKNLAVGALVAYPDRKSSGRHRLNLTGDDVTRSVFDQLSQLHVICQSLKTEITHVRPQGALYMDAAYDTSLAEALLKGIAKFSENLLTIAFANSKMLGVFESAGFDVAGEGFADQVYDPNGSLRPLESPGALFSNVADAAAQGIDVVTNQFVKTSDGGLHTVQSQTLHIRSDTKNSVEMAEGIHDALKSKAVTIKNLISGS